MSIDWIQVATIGGVIVGALATPFLIMWWLARQYFLLQGKGYGRTSAQLIVIGSSIGGASACVPTVPLLYGSTLITPVMISLIVAVIAVPVFATPAAVVAALPRRDLRRRAGARAIPFALSATARWLARGLWCAGVASVVYTITMLLSSLTLEALRPLQFAGAAFTAQAMLVYYRKRASAPKLEEAVSADPRPAVLYLRAFHQESLPFMWGPKKEMSQYTKSFKVDQAWRTLSVTFEQYLGGEFTRELGPFIALGNPADGVPPEGAARRYAADNDWQQNFVSLAEAAAALVIEPSYSDSLRWEITTIITHHWQCKLFIITQPTPLSKPIRTELWGYAAIRIARRLPAPSWQRFTAELAHAGLHIDITTPSPGSVISFDAEARPVFLIRGATKPNHFVAVVKRHLQVSEGSRSPRIGGNE
jgi:hypothetical protein